MVSYCVSFIDSFLLSGKLKIKVHAGNSAPTAPGMLSRHYAPNTTTILTDNIDIEIEKYLGKRIGVLQFKKNGTYPIVSAIETLSAIGDT